MGKFLKINEKMIIRDEDKMVFSAKNMKIFKFNDKGYRIVELINKNNRVEKDNILSLLDSEYSKEEFNHLIDKMIDNEIIIEYEE